MTDERRVPNDAEPPPGPGHNAGELSISVELRLFNRVQRHAGGAPTRRSLDLPPGATVGEVLGALAIPADEIFIAFVNGRDISAAPGEPGLGHVLDEGDVLALGGPVPYSWGYGAPVV